MPPAIALPIVTRSGSSPHAAVHPPGPADSVCVSSMINSVPVASHAARSPARKPSSGRTIPMFVSAGSVSTHATCRSSSSRRTASRSLNSHTRVVTRRVDRRPDVAVAAARARAGVERHERLVDRAVIAVAEDEHVRAGGHRAAEAQRPAVRVGRGQREAPQRDAEAAAELLADGGGVLRRQHERRAALLAQPPLHRGDRRGRRVARHRAGVAEREVDVRVAVDVGDARPVRARRVDGVAADPLAIHVIGTPPTSDARARSKSSRERGCVGGEALALGAVDGREALAIEVGRCRHGRTLVRP